MAYASAEGGGGYGVDASVIHFDPAHGERPALTIRRAGDAHVLVEFGPNVLDLDLRVRVHALHEALERAHVEGEFVMTCAPVRRSIQALWRIPWWPGWLPVRIVVWLARVTVGSDASAPYRQAVPSPIRRATFGASPRPARS